MHLFHYMLLSAVCVLASACNDTPPAKLSSSPKADHSDIADPYERWKAHKPDNYSMVEEIFCFCDSPYGAHKVIVRDGKVVDAIRLDDNRHLPEHELKNFVTIAELFARLQRVQADASIDSITVEFDDRLGYPTSLFIDPKAYAVDDEIGYRISSVEEL